MLKLALCGEWVWGRQSGRGGVKEYICLKNFWRLPAQIYDSVAETVNTYVHMSICAHMGSTMCVCVGEITLYVQAGSGNRAH